MLISPMGGEHNDLEDSLVPIKLHTYSVSLKNVLDFFANEVLWPNVDQWVTSQPFLRLKST